MKQSHSTSQVAIDAGRPASLLGQFGIVIGASLLLTLSAKVSIPFFPVPMTLQSMVVLMLGVWLGPRLALAALALYLAQGAAGFPVFAGTPERGIGLAYMVGPTGGFLAGFLVAAPFVGHLVQRGWNRNVVGMFLAATLGTAVIYAFGLAWLGASIGWDKPVLALGLYPFLLGDLLKIAIVALSATAVRRFRA